MRIISIYWLVLALVVLIPLRGAYAQEGFTIQPGDILQITVWKEEGMDREVLVLPDGTITFPLVGALAVQDVSPHDLQSAITLKLQPYIPDAAVTVSVKAPLGHKVSVIGQVQKPGEIIMGTPIGVMEALSQAGGLTPYADENGIIVIRKTPEGKESIRYPYKNIARGRNLELDINLKPGDVVVVPTSGLF